MRPTRLISLLPILLCTILVSRASAQVTTANLRGRVVSEGQPFAGVEVTLLHVPSGDVKTASTNGDGEYAFTGLRVGGPYSVSATQEGFKPTTIKEIYVTAGKTRDVEIELKLQEEVIEVAGSVIPHNTSNRTVVTAAEINELASVSRDPRDFVRRSPDAIVNSDHSLSIGGNNTRFNSITVDGIAQNDDFGLSGSGYPTIRSPIAISSIEELAIESSPFDVRYGKFMGGNVNIVTKSGTNDLHGQLLGTYSSDALIGHHVPVFGNPDYQTGKTGFHEYRYGVALGGPIVKDRVHFFFDAEGLNASTPVSVGPAGSGAVNITSKVTQDELAQALDIARTVYNFDPGAPSRNLDETDLKLLAKVDATITKAHRVTGIFQHGGGNAIANSFASDTTLPLSSNWYNADNVLTTFSGRLISDWSDKLSTEAEVAAKIVTNHANPLNGNGFMQASIRTPEGGTIVLGPDRFRHTNELENDLIHTKLLANYLAGEHLLTAGVEYDQLKIHNLFISDTNGTAVYTSLANFQSQTPTSITYSNAVTLNPADGAADWTSGTLTAYAQDQFKIADKLTLTGGLRFEVYQGDNNIRDNPNFYTRNGFHNTSTLNGRNITMPRLGISYLPTDRLNLRGGVGLYSGGSPNVWVSNNYSNDGVRIASAFDQNVSDIKGFDGRTIPLALKNMISAGNGNVDALDPNFKLPSAWKAGAGADIGFDVGPITNITLKLNYTYTKVFHGVAWVDLRRCTDAASTSFACTQLPGNAPIGTTPDGRPLYDSRNFVTSRGYDMLLTNDNRGYGHVASLQLEKGFPFGLFLSGSYAYQNVYETNPANSSRSVSSYDNVAVIDPNHLTLSTSNYERAHRLTGVVEFTRALIGDLTDKKPWKNMKTSIGLFAETNSGQAYSWSFADSAFGSTLSGIFGEERTFAGVSRQLFYVPKGDGSDVVLNGINQADFDTFLKQTGLDKYKGQIAPRNAFHTPWISRIDVRLSQDLPNPLGHRARVMLDIENVGNMISSKWGRNSEPPFPYSAPAVDIAYDTATNRYIYSNLRNPDPSRVNLRASVWRASIGLMYDF